MKATRKRVAIVATLIILGAFGAWAFAPLFLETRIDVVAPEGYTILEGEGTWQGVDDFHFARGVAKILGNGHGDYLLRVENFGVRNGPDIRFFLSIDASVGPGDIDLGSVPATSGNYNVAIPGGTDVSVIRHVLVHCVPADFLFARASLA